ncbi:hypothetical protein CR513_57820, partial [Mucuna pruriens]
MKKHLICMYEFLHSVITNNTQFVCSYLREFYEGNNFNSDDNLNVIKIGLDLVEEAREQACIQ